MTLPLPHQVKVGYGLRDEAGCYGVIVDRGTTRNAWTGDLATYVDVLWQSGKRECLFLIDLLEVHDQIELLGMYKAASHSRGKKAGTVRFTVGGDKDSSHPAVLVPYQADEGVPKLAQFVQHWEATYAPRPAPEPQPEPVNHLLTRSARIEAGRAALKAWGQTEPGRTFWNLWAELEKVAKPEGDEFFVAATRREVRDFLRRSGGWRRFYAGIKESA